MLTCRYGWLGLQPGDVLLDYPTKTQMLGLDLLVLRRTGTVRRLTAEGWQGSINLPKLSEEFYRSARWLRVYTSTRLHIESRRVLGLVQQSAEQVRERVALGSRLLD